MYFSLEASMKNSVQLRHEKNFPDGLLVNSNDASEKQSGHACFFMRSFLTGEVSRPQNAGRLDRNVRTRSQNG